MYREQSKLSLVGYLLGPSGKRKRLGLRGWGAGSTPPPDFGRYINPMYFDLGRGANFAHYKYCSAPHCTLNRVLCKHFLGIKMLQ